MAYKDQNVDERQQADQHYDPYSDRARDLYRQENDSIPGYDRANDGLDDHPVSGGDASGKSGDTGSGATKNIDDTKDKEEQAGSGWNTNVTPGKSKARFDLRNVVKKKGPLGALILLLGGGGIGIVGLLSPSLLLVQITDMFTNNFNDANTALSVRTNVMLGEKIKETKNSFAESSDGKCGIRCKFGSTSDTMIRNLKAKGYTVESTSKFGRHTIQKITFPDGTEVKNGKEFKAVMKDPVKAAQFARVFNSRTAYFLNSKFGSMLRSKLGIDKVYKLSGESKDKFKQSFRTAIGLPPTASSDPNTNKTDDEKLNESPRYRATSAAIVKLSGTPSNALEGACFAHDTSRVITASLKIAKMQAYAAFAMTFFNAAHKLKAGDGGGIDPLVVSELGDMLTYTDANKTTADGKPNELYGLSATDSYGYKAAAYGDTGTRPTYAQQHSLEASGLVGFLSVVAFFSTSTPEARAIAHGTCKGAGSDLATFIQCAPTAPTIIGYAGCVAANILAGVLIGQAVNAAMPHIIKAVIDTNLSNLDENTKGALAGDVLYPGAGAIMGGLASSYGMKAGNKEEIASYIAMSEEVRKQDEAIARIEAKQAPLDIHNQHSFLGSMVRSMNLASYANSSLTSTASKLASTIPQSFNSLVTTTNAGTFMPVAENKINQYGVTECPALETIGVAGDAYCMPAYVKSNAELSADTEANLDFMIENNYIDETTGEPKADSPESRGKEFQKFLDHCTFRVDAMGETTRSISEGEPGDYEWFIGAKCNENSEMVENFRIYAMDEPVNAAINGEESVLKSSTQAAEPAPTTDASGPTENSGNFNDGGWAWPGPKGSTACGFECYAGHTGMDVMGVPSGSNVYAVRDGTVIHSGPDSYMTAGTCQAMTGMNIWQGTQYSITIEHNVNGSKYQSYYTHLQSNGLKVRVGQTVKGGDLIGISGNTGCSTGPHLHVGLYEIKANRITIDPTTILGRSG